jgi:peptidoglycan/xylan/chitin deacetylase (PgdA/CDA1 family)
VRPPRWRGLKLLTLVAIVVTGVALVSRGSDGAPSTSAAAGESKHLGGPANPLAASPAEQRAAVDRIGGVGRPVLCGGGSKPLVALTFDDGPGPYTRYTLRVLREHHARATFFLVAKEVLGWPGLADIPRTEAVHDAVGNHTFDHSSLPGLTADELDHQLGDAQTVIEAAAKRDVRLFRPPYGARDAAVDAEVGSLGMLQVLWSVDTVDSRGATAGDIVATIRSDVRPGSIVLLHENRGTTRNALPRILDVLRERHLRAVTVPELLAADPPSPAQLSSGSCY